MYNTCVYIYIHAYTYIYIYVYTYINIEREREREILYNMYKCNHCLMIAARRSSRAGRRSPAWAPIKYDSIVNNT